MKEIKWKLCRYTSEEQKDKIIALRKIVFKDEDPDKENIDFWDWEFQDNYAGSSDIFLAVDGEKVVGHYAVCPSNIIVDSEIKRGSIVVDVMTHPDYRFQGMFTKIGKYSLEEAGKDGIDFSYGFPIRKSVMPGHLNVGWKVAFKLPVYVYPVNFAEIVRKFLPFKPAAAVLGFLPQMLYLLVGGIRSVLGKRYVIEEDCCFRDTAELRKFIEKTSSQHRIMQYRDYSFLNWRYNLNKYRKYKVFFAYDNNHSMLGYIVLRKAIIYGLECVTIIDMQALQIKGSIINALLRCADRYAKECKAALVGCMINKNRYKRQLLFNLYIKSPYIFKFIVHKNRDMDYEEKILKTENWFVTWADTDDL